MRSAFRHWLSFVALASLLSPFAFAAAGEPAAGDARAWLSRIHAAAYQRNYEGTLVFSADGVLSSSRVAHFAAGGRSYELVEALDGRQQRVYRVDDVVHTLWPQTRTALVEDHGTARALPTARRSVDPRALDHYDALTEGVERVAGRDAQVLLLLPRDTLRYARRLWADRATGLMLRADVIGAGRAVLESSAFSELEVGIRPQPETVTQPLRKLDGYRVVRVAQQPVRLEQEGWVLERPVPGFRLAGTVKRPLQTAAGEAQVLQAVYTDGLTHVSLFIEPHDARKSSPEMAGQVGATGTLRQRRGDHWITVMGDVPPAALKAFADGLQRRR